MSELMNRPGPKERDRFVVCLRNVKVARGQLATARLQGVRTCEKEALRADLLVALEGYADAIAGLGAPVPRRLRGEIDLYRRLDERR